MQSKIQIIIVSLLLVVAANVHAQNVGIGTSSPNASAKLDVSDANRGFLPPRVALTATNNVSTPVASPVAGLMVYNTATAGSGGTAVSPGYYYCDGTQWIRMITTTNTNTLTSSGNTLTSTANGIAATASAVNSVSNTLSSNSLTTTVNGVTGSGVNIINSNTNSLSGANLTTTINGVASTALNLTPAVTAAISHTLVSSGSALTSTVNGVASTLTPAAGTIGASTYLGFDASGNLVKGATPTATTTNTLGLSGNTLTSTVNGVAATSSAVGTVSNTSSANNLTTTVNGITGTAVPMINTNVVTFSGSTITSTVNGVSSTAVNLSPLDSSIYKTDGTLRATRTVTMGANNLTFSSTTGNLIFNPSSTGYVGIGNTSPGSKLDVKGTLRLSGATSGYVGFSPAAAAGSTIYTLPAADGTSGQALTTNGSGTLSWAIPTTTNTLTSSTNTLTSTVNGVAATASAVNTVANTSSANNLSTTVNGVAGSTVPIINTNALSSSTNTLTSTVNGVASSGATIINSNALTAASSALTSTVNGVASTLTPAAGTIGASTFLGFDASGNLVKGSASSNAWNLTGNSGTSYATNFLGTSDNKSLRIKTNNAARMIVDSLGNVGIGTASPTTLVETMNGNLKINNNNNTAGQLIFTEPSTSGSNYSSFKAQAQSANITYTLPATVGAANAILTNDGAGNLSWTSQGSTIFTRKTSDQSVTNSTTLVNDNALQLAIGANEIWEVEFELYVSANDMKFAVTMPTGGTMTLDAHGDNGNDSNDDELQMTTPGTAYNFSTSNFDYSSSGILNWVRIKGLVINSSTAGTVHFQFAQLTSSGTACTVKTNSYFKATRMQ